MHEGQKVPKQHRGARPCLSLKAVMISVPAIAICVACGVVFALHYSALVDSNERFSQSVIESATRRVASVASAQFASVIGTANAVGRRARDTTVLRQPSQEPLQPQESVVGGYPWIIASGSDQDSVPSNSTTSLARLTEYLESAMPSAASNMFGVMCFEDGSLVFNGPQLFRKPGGRFTAITRYNRSFPSQSFAATWFTDATLAPDAAYTYPLRTTADRYLPELKVTDAVALMTHQRIRAEWYSNAASAGVWSGPYTVFQQGVLFVFTIPFVTNDHRFIGSFASGVMLERRHLAQEAWQHPGSEASQSFVLTPDSYMVLDSLHEGPITKPCSCPTPGCRTVPAALIPFFKGSSADQCLVAAAEYDSRLRSLLQTRTVASFLQAGGIGPAPTVKVGPDEHAVALPLFADQSSRELLLVVVTISKNPTAGVDGTSSAAAAEVAVAVGVGAGTVLLVSVVIYLAVAPVGRLATEIKATGRLERLSAESTLQGAWRSKDHDDTMSLLVEASQRDCNSKSENRYSCLRELNDLHHTRREMMTTIAACMPYVPDCSWTCDSYARLNNNRLWTRTVTVMHCALDGFNAHLMKSADPSDLFDILTSYSSIVSNIVELHDGVVEHTIGDSIVTVWGLTRTAETQAARGTCAALHLLNRITSTQMNAASGSGAVPTAASTLKRCADEGFGLNVRLGLATGSVTGGNVTADTHLVPGCTGAPVHLARRLMQMTTRQGTRALLCHHTVESLPRCFVTSLVGVVDVAELGLAKTNNTATPRFDKLRHAFDVTDDVEMCATGDLRAASKPLPGHARLSPPSALEIHELVQDSLLPVHALIGISPLAREDVAHLQALDAGLYLRELLPNADPAARHYQRRASSTDGSTSRGSRNGGTQIREIAGTGHHVSMTSLVTQVLESSFEAKVTSSQAQYAATVSQAAMAFLNGDTSSAILSLEVIDQLVRMKDSNQIFSGSSFGTAQLSRTHGDGEPVRLPARVLEAAAALRAQCIAAVVANEAAPGGVEALADSSSGLPSGRGSPFARATHSSHRDSTASPIASCSGRLSRGPTSRVRDLNFAPPSSFQSCATARHGHIGSQTQSHLELVGKKLSRETDP
jgi:class 3 adenylate cyclase